MQGTDSAAAGIANTAMLASTATNFPIRVILLTCKLKFARFMPRSSPLPYGKLTRSLTNAYTLRVAIHSGPRSPQSCLISGRTRII